MKHFDILFLIESGIGNTLEVLYAVEHCLNSRVKTGLVINRCNSSFVEYLKRCYGEEVIMTDIDNLSTKHLVHSFTYCSPIINIRYEYYYYICPDKNSSQYLSETEQSLSLVKALYPSDKTISPVLNKLIADKTERVAKLVIEDKYIFYSGCSYFNPVRRWPYYLELMEILGREKVIFVGGLDELNNEFAYIYPKWLTKLFPRQITNRKLFWSFCKRLTLLKTFAHNNIIGKLENGYFNVFTWGELVYLFRHCKGFVGNDGGLMHLASAADAKGVAIFGATSVNKSKSYNSHIKEITTNYPCQPCFFEVAKIAMAHSYISCPYQVKCLTNISCKLVIDLLNQQINNE